MLTLTVATAFAALAGVFIPDRDDPAIEYASPARDPVSLLNDELEAGRVRLSFDSSRGYLPSVLEALKVPIESQMAVFSKTSVQAAWINPQNPRTLFFNDSVAVGWVRGGFIELAAQDPQHGVNFYMLDQTNVAEPRFTRRNDCFFCHDSNDALGIASMLVRSNFTAPNGMTMRQGSYSSDHRSPLEQRWGGWYVTGMSGSIRHRGNAMVTDPSNPESMITDQTLNLPSLVGKFDTDAYLSPYSDIVALLVFDHQMHMMNLLTRLGWQTRYALYQSAANNAQAAPNPEKLGDVSEGVRELVDYMLFVDEAPLANKIAGTSGFTEKFSAEGPHDKLGRSLRQLDLEHHLMKYPCSYMIYSEAFDGLPIEAKNAAYERLWRILSGGEKDPKYARLTFADRQAIVGILRETKNGLPDYFQAVTR